MRRSMTVSLLLAALMLVARNSFAHDETSGPSRASATVTAEVRSAVHGHTRRVLDLVDGEARYVDVSVPERAVVG